MTQKIIRVGNIEIANDKPFVLFGGMNVLESRDLAMKVCEEYVRVTEKLGIPYVFKASFDIGMVASLPSSLAKSSNASTNCSIVVRSTLSRCR